MTKTERTLTHEQRYTDETVAFWNVDDVDGDVYVTDGTYTIVLKDCIMFDKELDVDEFDEILEQLLNDEENEDGWVMANVDVHWNTVYEMTWQSGDIMLYYSIQ